MKFPPTTALLSGIKSHNNYSHRSENITLFGKFSRQKRVQSISPMAADEFTRRVDALLDWLKKYDVENGGQVSNYSVGCMAGGQFIISRVGGLTGKARVSKDLLASGELPKICPGSEVYLAKKYSSSTDSGLHGEMCVLAGGFHHPWSAANELLVLKCTEPNCDFCTTMLAHLNITAGTIDASGKASGPQLTWAHPICDVYCGTSYSAQGISMGSITKALGDFNDKYLSGKGVVLSETSLSAEDKKYLGQGTMPHGALELLYPPSG